jgi:T-complex protein 1 subunit eta
MNLIVESVNGNLQTSLESISNEENVGRCEKYEERTIGGGRYSILSGCQNTNHVTIILRGSSEELLKEVFCSYD